MGKGRKKEPEERGGYLMGPLYCWSGQKAWCRSNVVMPINERTLSRKTRGGVLCIFAGLIISCGPGGLCDPALWD